MRQWAPPCRPQRGSAELSFSPLGGFARFGPLLAHTILELFLFTRWAMQIVLSRSVSFRCVFLLLLPASASAHSSRSTIDQYQIDQLDACLDFHGDEQHADSWLRAVDCSETDALCSASASSEACLYITSDERRDAYHSSRAQVMWPALVWMPVFKGRPSIADWDELLGLPYPPWWEGDTELQWVLLYDSKAAAKDNYPTHGGVHCAVRYCAINMPSEPQR
jgi:hypothetical protein